MRLTVFGATGRTGIPLLEQALSRGHEVVAFVRNPEKLSEELRDHESVTVVEGDAYTGENVGSAIDVETDAVVSVLGQSKESPDGLLTAAGEHILAAMDDHGVERFVTLVGAGVREDGESVSLSGRVMGALLKLLARAALEDARDHVAMVRASGGRWTVVRGPRLTEDDHTGEFRHGTDIELGMSATAARANVAEFILDCLENGEYVNQMPKIADR
jgi:putative NADH-flavin reductase